MDRHRQTGANCRNLGTVYEDVIIPLATAGCDAGPVGCYRVLRKMDSIRLVYRRDRRS
ncbi:MAG: hypothetical protein IPL98_19540 [Saprospiraceae bacterium]|nr:hypothetical protein [Saprospiraceae bacterium]